MAAVVGPYLPNVYHQQSCFFRALTPVPIAQIISNDYYRPEQQQRLQPSMLTRTIEPVDSNVVQLHPRRAPRIRREVIVLPTPEPIYRQIRHRLPTPERQIIQRTVIKKSNGDVIIQRQRRRENKRSRARQKSNTPAQLCGTQQANNN